MTDPAESRFVYVSYIATTPDRLWQALTTPEFTRLYWYGMHIETDWQQGSPWRLVNDAGELRDEGILTRVDRLRLIDMTWRNAWKPELAVEGEARCLIEIEPTEDGIKLSITHTIARTESPFIAAVSGGWPKIVSGLKTLLETGKVTESA